MITLISLASLQHPNYEAIKFKGIENSSPQATISVVQNHKQAPLSALQAYTLPFKGNISGFKQEFRLPQNENAKGMAFDNVIQEYSPKMEKVIAEFGQRQGEKGQFLNWVSLPQAQLEKNEQGKSHLDEIYTQAAELKSRKTVDGKERPLVVLGIGGSKHTAEFLLNLNGVGNKGKVMFYSDIDPISYNNFVKEVGDNVKNLNFMVVSKSGTTFETSDGYKRFENALIEGYKNEGLSESEAKKKAQAHFAFATDATANEKNLRGKIGDKNGENNDCIKELYIHDDVGGRYSMFDDPGIFAMAYAGVEPSVAERILKGADETSKKALSAGDLKNNSAAKAAIFNVYSRENGYTINQQQLFGKLFETGGENWYKQLYLESLKDFNFMVGKSPDSMHYATEGQFDPNNRNKYHTTMTIMEPTISENYNKYTSAIAGTYNETTPLQIEKLAVEGDKIKPEAIGEYIQSKHFETVYMGMLRREVAGEKIDDTQALPEVLQPSVEVYKNKFKSGSPFELSPGK